MEQLPGIDHQYKMVLDFITGHEAFKRIRGQWKASLLSLAHHCINNSDTDGVISPSGALKIWQALQSDSQIMLNKLAQWRRDGFNEAAFQLEKLLSSPGYCLPEESLPKAKTVTVSLVVPEAHKAITEFFYLYQSLDIISVLAIIKI